MLGDLELLIYHFVIYSMLVVVLLLSRLTTGFNSRVAELRTSEVDGGVWRLFCTSLATVRP